MSQDNGTLDGADTSREQSHSDFMFASRSRRGSLGSSRFSGRPSLRSSVRDDAQTLDEFLRKQGVIRFMQEERERAARSKLLREEHDAWVEFRANERSERLKFMTEQEIAELLQREADEALRDNRLAEVNAKSTIDESARQRQGLADVWKKGEDAVVPRKRSEVDLEHKYSSTKREITETVESRKDIVESYRGISRLRDHEEGLQRKCQDLERQLEEAKKSAALARDEPSKKATAEDKKAREQLQTQKKANDDLRKQLEEVRRASQDAKTALESSKQEASKLQASAKVKDRKISDLQEQLAKVTTDKEAAAEVAALSSREIQSKSSEEVLRAKVSLQQEQEARKSAESRASDLQKQLEAAKKSSKADTIRAKDSVLRAKEEALKEQQRLHEETQREVTRLRSALTLEKTAREVAERSVAEVHQRDTGRVDEDAQRRIAELEQEIARLRRQLAEEQRTIDRLNAELRDALSKLSAEAAGRAKFEELASKAVDPSAGRGVKGEVAQLQSELDEARRDLVNSKRESDTSREFYEREIEALKVYCGRLKEQQQQQQTSEAIHSNRDSPNKLFSVKMRPADTVQPDSSKAVPGVNANSEDLNRLQQELNALRGQLMEMREKEKRADAELKKAHRATAAAKKQAEAAKRAAGKTKDAFTATDKPAESVPRAREVAPIPHQQSDDRLAELAKENAELKRRYDTLFKAHKATEKARSEAVKEVSVQSERIQDLEKDIENSAAHVHPPVDIRKPSTSEKAVSVAEERSGAAAADAAVSATAASANTIKDLEQQLMNERASREAAEQHLKEEKEKTSRLEQRAVAAEKKVSAAEKTNVAEERFANAQAASAQKKQRATCACC